MNDKGSNASGAPPSPTDIVDDDMHLALSVAAHGPLTTSPNYWFDVAKQLANALLLQSRRSRGDVIEECRKAAIAECKRWDKNMGGDTGKAIGFYINKSLRSLRGAVAPASTKGES